jgi:hypothetical protein
MSTTGAIKWKQVDHLTDPVSLAVARVSTGQKSFTDDEVVAVVNAAPVSAIGGLVLPLTQARRTTISTTATTFEEPS